MKRTIQNLLRRVAYTLLPLIGGAWVGVACSETDDADATDEYAHWQQRNEAFWATLADSLSRGSGDWLVLKTYSKDPRTDGAPTDYVYAKVLTRGQGTDSPLYTDSVRIAYRGRLIPTASHPEGYVFDQTYVGTYSRQTTAVADGVVSSFVEGFATALQHMVDGDRWRVYIPAALGYGSTAKTGVPAHSVLVFDIDLIGHRSDTGEW